MHVPRHSLFLRTRTLLQRRYIPTHLTSLQSQAALRLFTTSDLPDGVEELTMPALSPTMESGTITKWLKKAGESVEAGEVLCQIETDKAVVDYEMQDDAVLVHIVLPEGTSDVAVGASLAYTVEDMETYNELKASGSLELLSKPKESADKPQEESKAAIQEKQPEASSEAPRPRVPLIKFLGKRSLLHAQAKTSSDAKVEVTAETKAVSPESTSSESSGSNEFSDLAISNMRKVIAKRLTASKVNVPHHYASIDCEIDNILALRKSLKAKHGVAVSLNDFLLKAVALALRDVPEANCYFDDKLKSIAKNPSVDISVAVATDTGLITPIVPKVDSIGLSRVNAVFKELVSKARSNKLKPEEYQGGSFTVSNLGGFGISEFTAVINPPQACILAVGGGRKELVPVETTDETLECNPRIATLMNCTLSSDRRVVDDVIASQFLQVFKSYMESPELMVL